MILAHVQNMLQSVRRLCTMTTKYSYKTVQCFQPSILATAFSTLESPQNPLSPICCKNNSIVDESYVLSQLSNLLPVSSHRHAANPPLDNPLEFGIVDAYLSPEDKLRGVFLQKLRSKAAIHRALSDVAVELNCEVFAKVVNRGNLCGEAMVVFFHWAVKQPNISDNVLTYNVILKALGRRKFFVHLLEMLNEMIDKKLIPNSETLYIIMDSYIRAHHVSKAIGLFKELGKYGLKCDEETLNVTLRCLCARSHVGIAWSLFTKTREKVQCCSTTYNIIIGGWSSLGQVNEVEKCLKAMVDDGVKPDCVTYSYLIESLGRAGRVDDAVKIFDFLEEKGDKPSTAVYNAIIFNFLARGNIDEALKYREQMLTNSCEPNMDTYVRIIRYFLKIRRVADSMEMFDEMLDRGIIPSTGTLTEFLEPLCRYGPPYAALMIYKKAKKAGCRISFTAYKLLLMRLSRFGKCGMLLSTWNEMQENGYSSDTHVYEYIINGLCNTGRLETAVLVMEECLSKGFFPDKVICSKLSNKLMDSNRTVMSYKLFLKLKRARLNENAQRYWRAKGWHF
ncbi:uncharacterized protein [Henckelia pumila]|uniref:uncharacterized protein n=1 Tax=Henckelia pumila TaxID=405737 RepID=UPI003C6E287A